MVLPHFVGRQGDLSGRRQTGEYVGCLSGSNDLSRLFREDVFDGG
jgi:hypothetical protein